MINQTSSVNFTGRCPAIRKGQWASHCVNANLPCVSNVKFAPLIDHLCDRTYIKDPNSPKRYPDFVLKILGKRFGWQDRVNNAYENYLVLDNQSNYTKAILPVKQLAERLPEDTGLMIIADHSQVDVEHYALDQDAEICECLALRPSLEPRAASFFIKEGKKEQFEKLFRERFKDSFLLLSHDEVISSNLFGSGTAHERFEEFIGDYLAIALTPVQFDYLKGSDMRGNHAGGMEEEALIPLILDPRL